MLSDSSQQTGPADTSEQIGLFGKAGTKTEHFRQRVKKSNATMYNMI